MSEQWKLILAETTDFPRIYEIMLEAFPPSERRTEEGQRALFENRFYKVYLRKSGERVLAFLAVWEFPEISFIEHFAVNKGLRGSGMGKEMLSEYLKSSEKPVFLEVEPPENEVSARRIGFYERLGFCLNGFPYCQPALQEGQEPLPLKIMTYPEPVGEEDFSRYKKTAFKNAYPHATY